VVESWINRCSNAQNWPSPKEDYVECLAGSKRDYSLGISSNWLHHHCWSLLSTTGPSRSKTPGRSSIDFIFGTITPDLTLQSRRVKNYGSSDGLRLHIHLTLETWLLRTPTCIVLFLTIYARKNSTTRAISKWTSWTSLSKSPRTSTNARLLVQFSKNLLFNTMHIFLLVLATTMAQKRKAPAPPVANCFNVPDTLDPLAFECNLMIVLFFNRKIFVSYSLRKWRSEWNA
jgi:hypothetical protein